MADVFENARKIFLEIYQQNLAKFLIAPGSAWLAALKKIKVELEILTYIHMLLILEKGIRGEICQSLNRCAKANNKYMK